MKRSDVTALLIAVPAVLLLTAASLLAVALWGAPRSGHSVGSICTAPALPGTTVHVSAMLVERDRGGCLTLWLLLYSGFGLLLVPAGVISAFSVVSHLKLAPDAGAEVSGRVVEAGKTP